MKLDTERLIIKVLTLEEMENFIQAIELNTDYEGIFLNQSIATPEIKDFLKEVFLKRLKTNPSNYVFNSLWIIYEKINMKLVGHFCFNTALNPDGSCEVYFGIHDDERKKGFMKESLARILDWCATNGKIKKINTTVENFNSDAIKLLAHFGFVKVPETNYFSQWIKEI